MKQRLFRSIRNKKIAGVCAGLAEYFDVDPALIRVAFVFGTLLHGMGILAYIILWIAVPENPREFYTQPYQSGPDTSNSFEYVEPVHMSGSKRGTIFAGIGLIVIGVFFLLDNLFPWFDFENYSPLLLIAGGIMILSYGFMSKQTPIVQASGHAPSATVHNDDDHDNAAGGLS